MTFLPKPETTHWRRPNTTNTGKGWAREFTERERERKQKKRGRQEREEVKNGKEGGEGEERRGENECEEQGREEKRY